MEVAANKKLSRVKSTESQVSKILRADVMVQVSVRGHVVIVYWATPVRAWLLTIVYGMAVGASFSRG